MKNRVTSHTTDPGLLHFPGQTNICVSDEDHDLVVYYFGPLTNLNKAVNSSSQYKDFRVGIKIVDVIYNLVERFLV